MPTTFLVMTPSPSVNTDSDVDSQNPRMTHSQSLCIQWKTTLSLTKLSYSFFIFLIYLRIHYTTTQWSDLEFNWQRLTTPTEYHIFGLVKNKNIFFSFIWNILVLIKSIRLNSLIKPDIPWSRSLLQSINGSLQFCRLSALGLSLWNPLADRYRWFPQDSHSEKLSWHPSAISHIQNMLLWLRVFGWT